MEYKASQERYGSMEYRRSGRSGLLLPALSLGMWQNFGEQNNYDLCCGMLLGAFDNGITYIDLANNYGPPPGSAETMFGRIFEQNLRPYRDELIVTSKAGYTMWDGPYGDHGSRKYLVSSCDQSLRRTGLDYFDIFYSHRYDPQTPLEETMGALDYIVRSGRALYAALSNYPPEVFVRAVAILRQLGTPCVAHQIKYSMLVENIGDSLFEVHAQQGVGCVSFSPLAQGLLSDRYLNGVPEGSRGSRQGSLQQEFIEANIVKVAALNDVAHARGQSLSQMAIAWQLCDTRVTSVLVGVSSFAQLHDNIAALRNTTFSPEELAQIRTILA